MKALLAMSLLVSSVAFAAGPPAGKDRAPEKKDQKGERDSNGVKGPPQRSELCHKTDEGTQITLRLPAPAVKAHLDHGDSEGACASGTRKTP